MGGGWGGGGGGGAWGEAFIGILSVFQGKSGGGAPPPALLRAAGLLGVLRGSVIVGDGGDVTVPVSEDGLLAEDRVLHG